MHDVVIVGGGPAGLSAALALGRARKRVLLCDAGPRRNAAAAQLHNFVTRDGTPPDELRGIARAQLAAYPDVAIQDAGVRSITGERGAFRVDLGAAGVVEARRVLLATGMIDETLPIDGFSTFWGHSIVQCPYCHGWEARDRAWGLLMVPPVAAHLLVFAQQLRGWTRDVTVFTGGAHQLAGEDRATLEAAGIRIETAAIARLAGAGALERVELADDRAVPVELLFAHPPQRHVPVVAALGLELDEGGYVKLDPMKRETSRPGVFAAGDLTTRMQGAMFAAAAGTQAAAAINLELTLEQPLGH